MLITLLLLVSGFVVLVKGAGLLVDGASSIARKLKVSDLMIGLTVVAFGTSFPELFVNIVASLEGNAGIALSNVIGSNIANILLILGISSVVFPLVITKGTVWREIPLNLLAALLLWILANDVLIDKGDISLLTRIDGLVFLAFFGVYIYYLTAIARNNSRDSAAGDKENTGYVKVILGMAFGLIGLTLGSKLIVDGAAALASKLGVSQFLIGLTIVAVGTSLPELATSVVAALKKNAEIAVGNIVGSNIFNIFFVLGVSAVIKPLAFDKVLNIDLMVVIFSSLLLFLSMFTWKRHQLDRKEGIIFVVLYIVYVVYLVTRG